MPSRSTVETKSTFEVVVVLRNESAATLSDIVVSIIGGDFSQEAGGKREEFHKAFLKHRHENAAQGRSSLWCAQRDSSRKYRWALGGMTGDVQKVTRVNVEVVLPFNDIARSLPGGTGPLLYLVLPILPALYAFGMAEQLRKKAMSFKVPEIGKEQIALALLGSLIVNLVMLVCMRDSWSVAYGEPRRLLGILVASALVGALPSLAMWLREKYRWWRRAFRSDDSHADYVRKVLLQRGASLGVDWITVMDEAGTEWQGARLTQPDGSRVLGATLQVTPALGKIDQWERAQQINEKQPALVIKLIRRKMVETDFIRRVKRGDEAQTSVVIPEPPGLQTPSDSKSVPLVIFKR